MKKVSVIAQCLVNSRLFNDISEASIAVEHKFKNEFPGCDFYKWNTHIDNSVAENIINTVGVASEINVAKFISDLWE